MIYLESIKKYLWVAKYLTVALCAYLSANAVSIYIRGALSAAPVLNIASTTGPSVTTTPLNDYDIILKRSLFNSAGVNMEASLTKKDQGPAITADNFNLLGTIAGMSEISYALIQSKSDSKTDLYKVGDKIAGDTEVVDIRTREVELQRAGNKMVIRLPELGEVKLGMVSPERWKKGVGEKIAEGIQKLGDGKFEVKQELIDGAFGDWAKLMRGARIMPNIENGSINGFKMSNIRKDSLYSQIGMQNGDILHRVNSVEIKNPEDALKLFQELKTSKNINIDVTRGGQRQTLSYTVK